MNKRFLLVLTTLLLLFTLPSEAAYGRGKNTSNDNVPKGHLVIIGGGKRVGAITERIIALSGGANARILYIASASGNPEKAAATGVEHFRKNGARNIEWIAPTREECDDPEYVKKHLDGVGGIYFCGGKQSRIVNAIGGTLFHKRLKEMYREGVLISGSSAGAAIMSTPMISGKRADKEGKKFDSISENIVKTIDGLGFLEDVTIDQHFLKRNRENRLFSLAFDHPEKIAIGIDESTAIIVTRGTEMEVIGKSSVMVIRPLAKSIRTDERGNYGGSLDIDIYIDGDKFSISPNKK